ncbi:MAG: cation:dicarboxylase symporter family transporter [Spirochaetaceae bacterium]|jgi:Na+/H+-dicarboxylate symporter|nr:cation:dicarboxylase symporter family transporter [Spirochaetaceae bacterium]
MKIWLKLLIGSLLGVFLGFLLPGESDLIQSGLFWLQELAIQIGRYTVVPLLFFALTIAIYELRQDKRLWSLILKTLVFILAGTVLMVFLGIFVTFVFSRARIHITMAEQQELISLHLSDAIKEIFPSNMLAVFGQSGLYLLPVAVLAFFMGMGLSYDRNYTKTMISLVDSLSRIFYHIASFFSEILGLIIIILGAYWSFRFREALRADIFRDILLLIGVFSLILGFGILPALLYLLRPKTNPWKILYGSLGAAITALVSGDINFTLPLLFRQARENLGVRRRANTVIISLFTSFGRAGSATVAAMAFIVIIQSYSSLGVEHRDILIVALRTIGISFLLFRHPGDGAYTAIAVLSAGFSGKGFEAGYPILKPMAFYLIALGTFLDIMFASLGTYAISKIDGFQEDQEVRHYI